MGVERRSARGIVVDGQDLLLLKRTRPGHAPYWTTPGGGVEPGESLQAALIRELAEEAGAEVEVVQPVFLASAAVGEGVAVQHFFLCRLCSLRPDQRAGPELGDLARGAYCLEWVDLAAGGLAEIALKPEALREFLLANVVALLDLVEAGTVPG